MAKHRQNKQAQLDRYWKMGIKNFKHDATVLPTRIFSSEEFDKLSGSAIKVLSKLLLQYNGFNNGDLSAPFTQSQSFGMSDKTLQRAVKELLDAQFIEVSRDGNKRQCTLYALTFYAIDECNGKHHLQPTTYPSERWKKSRQKLNDTLNQNYFKNAMSTIFIFWLGKVIFFNQMTTNFAFA